MFVFKLKNCKELTHALLNIAFVLDLVFCTAIPQQHGIQSPRLPLIATPVQVPSSTELPHWSLSHGASYGPYSNPIETRIAVVYQYASQARAQTRTRAQFITQNLNLTSTLNSESTKNTLLVATEQRIVLNISAATMITLTGTDNSGPPLKTSTPGSKPAKPFSDASFASNNRSIFISLGGFIFITVTLALIVLLTAKWHKIRSWSDNTGRGLGKHCNFNYEGGLLTADTRWARLREKLGYDVIVSQKTNRKKLKGALDAAPPSPKRFKQYEFGGVPPTATDRSIRPSTSVVSQGQTRKPSPLNQVYSASASKASFESGAQWQPYSEGNLEFLNHAITPVSTPIISCPCRTLSLSGSMLYGFDTDSGLATMSAMMSDIDIRDDSESDTASGCSNRTRTRRDLVNVNHELKLDDEFKLSESSRRILIDRFNIDDPFSLAFDCGKMEIKSASARRVVLRRDIRRSYLSRRVRAENTMVHGSGGGVEIGAYAATSNRWTIASNSDIPQEDIGVALWYLKLETLF